MPQNNQFKETPHYRVFLEAAITDYKSGYLTAKGALIYWLRIRLQVGWELNFNAKEISEMFGMGRSTLWAVLKQLKEEGRIDYEQGNKPKVKLLPEIGCLENEAPVSNLRYLSQIQDSCLENKTPVSNLRQPSQIQDEQQPESLQSKRSRTLSNSLSNSYQTFIKSLSEGEREKFENFVREEHKKETGQEIRSFTAFMRGEHFADWWDRFTACVTDTVDWLNHPKYEEWKSLATEMPAWFIHEGDKALTKNQRIAFVDLLMPQQREVS